MNLGSLEYFNNFEKEVSAWGGYREGKSYASLCKYLSYTYNKSHQISFNQKQEPGTILRI